MKNKIILKIIASILFVFSCFIMVSCEGSPKAEQRMKDNNGVWECEYILNSKTECAIGGWRYEYKQTHNYLSYVFIPSHINGIKVVQFGYTTLTSTKYYHGGGKIFFPYTMKKILGGSAFGENIFITTQSLENLHGNRFYVPDNYYNTYITNNPDSYIERANVVYDINYSNEEYKYHSVDNYEYGSLIEIIPPIPERDGYTFDGWYKEPECINKWNFETDTLPELKLDDEGNEIFQETALYAKWI